ncbi:MAG: SDR family NAD(P)-dependent oxidoreductase [Sphaerochaetaceae bacterium]
MRTILVSGGTSTLGKAICERLSKAGEQVYCGYASNKDTAVELAAIYGPSLIPIHLDVQDTACIASVVNTLRGLDVLVNNSGVFSMFSPTTLEEEEWQHIFDVNVTGLFRLTKQCIPFLEESQGCIVNIASINALHPGFGGTSHYDASKGAVVAYTKSLAKELAPFIRVNAVAPGLLQASYLDDANPLKQYYEKRALLHSLVDPDEVAKVVQLLIDCKAMTGELVGVDCGYLMG